MAYRIYTRVNFSEKPGEPDDIRTDELGIKDEIEDALNVARDFIKERFFQKDAPLAKGSDRIYRARDTNRYHRSVIVEELKVSSL